ncbi:MAG: DNA-processing protein DprA [Geminicoccales bacterium]
MIASSVDVAYPSENADLMPSIAETGAVISECPPNRAPMARHFPRRNRLISGLSSGVVVVEAAPKSGSLTTAHMAAEQGREVMAVPGSPLDARHRGTNQLIRKGATLVETAEDIVASLDNLALARSPRTPSRPFMADDPADLPDRPVEKRDVISSTGDDISLSVRSPEPTSDPTSPGGGTLIKRICERLGTEPLLVDELIRQCHANSSEMQHSFLESEHEGRIERHPGNRVSLATS